MSSPIIYYGLSFAIQIPFNAFLTRCVFTEERYYLSHTRLIESILVPD